MSKLGINQFLIKERDEFLNFWLPNKKLQGTARDIAIWDKACALAESRFNDRLYFTATKTLENFKKNKHEDFKHEDFLCLGCKDLNG